MSEEWASWPSDTDSLSGWFLMATPGLKDPNFFRTVVLIVQHDQNGAFGLVLNRPMDKTVRQVWEQVGAGDECEVDDPLYLGGPVAGPLIVLHDSPDHAEGVVIDGVYLATNPNRIRTLLHAPPSHLRVFTCYSGWAAGQLEMELEEGAWLTMPATKSWIFYDGGDLWGRLRRIREDEFFDAVLPSRAILEQDPELN